MPSTYSVLIDQGERFTYETLTRSLFMDYSALWKPKGVCQIVEPTGWTEA